MMVQMQKCDLSLFFSQNEEHCIQELSDFAHVVQPYGTRHLKRERKSERKATIKTSYLIRKKV